MIVFVVIVLVAVVVDMMFVVVLVMMPVVMLLFFSFRHLVISWWIDVWVVARNIIFMSELVVTRGSLTNSFRRNQRVLLLTFRHRRVLSLTFRYRFLVAVVSNTTGWLVRLPAAEDDR